MSAWATVNRWFTHVASVGGEWTGHPLAFIVSCLLVILWAVSGPLFGFSDTWQLVINTGTTVVTYLLIFLVQNTQNRSDRALHLKLDELLLKIEATSDRVAGVQTSTDEEFAEIEREVHSHEHRGHSDIAP